MPPKKTVSVENKENGDIVEKRGRRQRTAKTEDLEEKPVKTTKVKKNVESEPKVVEKKATKRAAKKTKEDKAEEGDTPPKKIKGAKKAVKKVAEQKDDLEEVEVKEPVKKSGRQIAKKTYKDESEDEDKEIEEKPKKVVKKGKKLVEKPGKADKKAPAEKKAKEPKTKEPKSKEPKMEFPTNWDDVLFTTDKTSSKGQTFNTSITTWNVAGLRAWHKKDGLSILKNSNSDIICLQETKCTEDELPQELLDQTDYKAYWCEGTKKGHAGVGLLTRTEPLKVSYGIESEDVDDEGRAITAEYEQFYVVCVYVPNAGRKLVTLPQRLAWNDDFQAYLARLNAVKPVIVCGDMNVAHQEIDLTNPKTNQKNAGFTPEERAGMTELLAEGYVDVFRSLYPDTTEMYTFWSYMGNSRAKNVGWRLDYFIVPETFLDNVCDVVHHTKAFGSDHCPLTLFFSI